MTMTDETKARRATFNAGHVDAQDHRRWQLQTKTDFSEPKCRLSRPLRCVNGIGQAVCQYPEHSTAVLNVALASNTRAAKLSDLDPCQVLHGANHQTGGTHESRNLSCHDNSRISKSTEGQGPKRKPADMISIRAESCTGPTTHRLNKMPAKDQIHQLK